MSANPEVKPKQYRFQVGAQIKGKVVPLVIHLIKQSSLGAAQELLLTSFTMRLSETDLQRFVLLAITFVRALKQVLKNDLETY